MISSDQQRILHFLRSLVLVLVSFITYKWIAGDLLPFIPPTGRLWLYASRPPTQSRLKFWSPDSLQAEWPALPGVLHPNIKAFISVHNQLLASLQPQKRPKPPLTQFVITPTTASPFIPRKSEATRTRKAILANIRPRKNGVEPGKTPQNESILHSKILQECLGELKLPKNHYALNANDIDSWPSPADWATLSPKLKKKKYQALGKHLPHYASSAANAIIRRLGLPEDHPMYLILTVLSLPDHLLLDLASNMPAWMLFAALRAREQAGDHTASDLLDRRCSEEKKNRP